MSTHPPVPMVDLKAQYARIREEVDRAVLDVLCFQLFYSNKKMLHQKKQFYLQ